MNNNKEIAIPKEKSVIAEQLAVYPPKLRKLGRYMIEIGQLITIKKACNDMNLNYDSMNTLICRYRRKGKDFNALVNSYAIKKLDNYKTEVYDSMTKRALSGSLGHQKLYSQLVGDYTERQQINHNLGAKIVVFSPGNVIPDDVKEIREKERDKDGVQIVDMSMDE